MHESSHSKLWGLILWKDETTVGCVDLGRHVPYALCHVVTAEILEFVGL
jgi:hypothetical protein